MLHPLVVFNIAIESFDLPTDDAKMELFLFKNLKIGDSGDSVKNLNPGILSPVACLSLGTIFQTFCCSWDYFSNSVTDNGSDENRYAAMMSKVFWCAAVKKKFKNL